MGNYLHVPVVKINEVSARIECNHDTSGARVRPPGQKPLTEIVDNSLFVPAIKLEKILHVLVVGAAAVARNGGHVSTQGFCAKRGCNRLGRVWTPVEPLIHRLDDWQIRDIGGVFRVRVETIG